MKYAIAAVVLFASASACAGNWIEVYHDPDAGPSFYVKPSSIRRSGEMQLAWVEYKLTVARQSPLGDGKLFVRMAAKLEFDCKNETSRFVSSILYDVSGAPIGTTHLKRDQTTADPDVPNSAGHSVLQYICSHQR